MKRYFSARLIIFFDGSSVWGDDDIASFYFVGVTEFTSADGETERAISEIGRGTVVYRSLIILNTDAVSIISPSVDVSSLFGTGSSYISDNRWLSRDNILLSNYSALLLTSVISSLSFIPISSSSRRSSVKIYLLLFNRSR